MVAVTPSNRFSSAAVVVILVPVISNVVADTSTAVNIPVAGLYVNPVSVSIPCVPVAPSTKVG